MNVFTLEIVLETTINHFSVSRKISVGETIVDTKGMCHNHFGIVFEVM